MVRLYLDLPRPDIHLDAETAAGCSWLEGKAVVPRTPRWESGRGAALSRRPRSTSTLQPRRGTPATESRFGIVTKVFARPGLALALSWPGPTPAASARPAPRSPRALARIAVGHACLDLSIHPDACSGTFLANPRWTIYGTDGPEYAQPLSARPGLSRGSARQAGDGGAVVAKGFAPYGEQPGRCRSTRGFILDQRVGEWVHLLSTC